MNTSELIALGSLVVSALALLWTLVGWIINRAHNRKVAAAAERAERLAERSAVAVERSATAQERVAQAFSDFLSRQERAAVDEEGSRAASAEAGDAAERFDPVRWTVDRRDDRSYLLTILRGNAHNVRLRADNAVRFDGPDGPIDHMTAGDTQSFLSVGSWETGVPQLVVTWEDADGTQREWRRVVP